MPGPFHNLIKGTTSGAPGTGSFTPSAASSGFLAWSTIPSGWYGLLRYEDGSAWEMSYGYWNGTTITRPSAGFVASSTSSQLSLTSSATASMVANGSEVMPHLARPWRGAFTIANSSTLHTVGLPTPTVTGTAAGGAVGSTNFLTEQVRTQWTSATTAHAQAGIDYLFTATAFHSSSAGRGGWEYRARFGASTLPTGPRLFVGMSSNTIVGSTAEPSALTANYAVLGKDSTDTNMQLLVNSNAGSGTKTDTGIPLTAGGLYDVTIWANPGSLTIYMLLVRVDTGDIYYGSTATDVPVTGTALSPYVIGGLSATTGTAFVLQFCSMVIRNGG